jgi:hypothetical protein
MRNNVKKPKKLILTNEERERERERETRRYRRQE